MKRIVLFALQLVVSLQTLSQLTINNTLYTPAQLVNGVLIPTGSGTTVSNIVFSGVYNNSGKYQVGYFTTAGTTQAQMGFTSGIVLTTGNTSTIPLTPGLNPQAQAQMATAYTSCTTGEIRETGTCPTIINDLNVLAGAYSYYNAAILEFDFVPVGTEVQFRYIFGSEEYTDNSGLINYQCSSYNDKFGFLISGPGIAGGQGYTNNARNIARLANGSEVSINAVNNGTVGSSGGAPSASKCLAANPSWVAGSATTEYLGTIDGTQLNGNTKILVASQSGLTPGQTYHIKLIVTDVYDATYDAVVYIEAASFTTNPCVTPATPTTGSVTQPNCTTPTGSVALSGLPATGNWTVTASPGGATLTGSGTTGTFTGLTPGSYTFSVSSVAGCSSAASSSVTVNAVPSAPSAPVVGTITQPSCSTPTGSVALSGLPSSGTWTITASPGGSTQTGTGTTATFTGLTPNTNYTFTVTTVPGCISPASSGASISAYSPATPVVSSVTQPTCVTATGSVNFTGLPSSGTWTLTATPGGQVYSSTGTTATFSGLASGSYTFTVTDNIGCVSSATPSTTINAQPVTPSAPVLGTITQPTCTTPTGSVALSGLPSTGSWTLITTPGGSSAGTGTTTTVSGLAPNASYSFQVTNSAGCTSVASASAAVNALPSNPGAPSISGITQPSCLAPTGSVSLGNLPAGTWTITASPGALTQTGSGSTANFTGLSSNTNYTFTVTETATGCVSPASPVAAISLYTPTPPVVGAITQPTCSVSTGSVSLSGLPVGSYTVTASPGGLQQSGSTSTLIFNGLPAGANYTFTVEDNSGCLSAASQTASIAAQPVTPSVPVNSSMVQPTCTVPTGEVFLTGLPAGNWTLNVTPGSPVTASGTTYSLSGLTPGVSYAVSVTNSDGCVSGNLNVPVSGIPSDPSAPVIGTITQPSCLFPDGSVQLSGLPTGSWTITATPGNLTVTGTGTTGVFGELSAGSFYTFTVTDGNGCTSSSSSSAAINSIPAPPAAPAASVTVQPTCTLPTGILEVSSPVGVNNQYSVDGVNFQSSTIFAGLAPGTYPVSVTDQTTGCTSTTTSVVVNAVPNGPATPVVNITAQPTCLLPTGTFEIASPLGANYSYSCNGSAQTGTTFSGLLPGQTYSVSVTDVTTGCVSGTYDVTFNSIPTPEAVDAGPDQTITSGESVTLIATGNGTLVWETGDTTSTIVAPMVTTTYTVVITDANGCSSSDDVTLFVPVECGELFVPTAFSPNGDAVNATFGVKINPDCVEEMTLSVFDRWGEKVFETEDPTLKWDGKYKGKELDPAVFVYTLSIRLIGETESTSYSGNLSLIK